MKMNTFSLLYVIVVLFTLDVSFASDNPTEVRPKPVASLNETKTDQPAKEIEHYPPNLNELSIPKTSEAPIVPVTPKPSLPVWFVEDPISHIVCIKLKSNITIEVPYNKTNSSASALHGQEKISINVPSSANATGSCGTLNSTEQYLVLKWRDSNKTNSLNFTFGKHLNEKFFFNNILADIFLPNVSGKDYHKKLSAVNLTDLATPLNMSYVCNKGNDLHLNSSDNEIFIVHFKKLQFEAFNTQKGNTTDFREARDCEPFITPDIVPIIVGCTLALLVIVVLVAYLISRKRSQARGYLSM